VHESCWSTLDYTRIFGYARVCGGDSKRYVEESSVKEVQTLSGIAALLAAASMFSGCPSSPGPSEATVEQTETEAMPQDGQPLHPVASLALNARVTRDTWPQSAGAAMSGATQMFHVALSWKNTGIEKMALDVVAVEFRTTIGPGLKATTRLTDASFLLEQGAFEQMTYTTPTYTRRLIEDAQGGDILFIVRFMRDDAVIAGPFHAVLPVLETLPWYADQRAAVVTLTFIDAQGTSVPRFMP
jgi:hypothetical protein